MSKVLYIKKKQYYSEVGGGFMCYNCGCGLPDNASERGNAGVDPDGKSITSKTMHAAALSQNMTDEATKWEVYKLLKKELEG